MTIHEISGHRLNFHQNTSSLNCLSPSTASIMLKIWNKLLNMTSLAPNDRTSLVQNWKNEPTVYWLFCKGAYQRGKNIRLIFYHAWTAQNTPLPFMYCWIEKEKRFINVDIVRTESMEVEEVFGPEKYGKKNWNILKEGPRIRGGRTPSWFYSWFFIPSLLCREKLTLFSRIPHTLSYGGNILHPISVIEEPLEKPFLISSDWKFIFWKVENIWNSSFLNIIDIEK